ncbi:MAG TPA: UDP-N-acetylmuramoyl-L-alanine--D-glutamate ligase [Opitutaceae bacterium]|jgi:UDP-N-acetylmuramoylalanine--D-glutamate ligase|nr:UDP-N-acetylmuramoyl-L-alanine--D-glutamate ligase [Opitutaceae bacterium]
MTLATPDLLKPLLAKPVAVLGAGVSGRAVAGLLGSLGTPFVLFDEKGGEGTAADFVSAAQGHSLVVFSPGFAPGHPWLAAARAAGATCLGELDFASLFWPGRVLAITGTNGKTTLTEFLTHALRSIGRDARAAGNIGHPLSQLVLEGNGDRANAIAVCEVSSFQAETLKYFRADAVLWTNFAEDHLERHGTMDDYFAAKWNLVARASPGTVFAGSSAVRFAEKSGRPFASGAAVASEARPADSSLAGTPFAGYPQRENFLLAAAWWRSEQLPPEALLAAARSFRLGPHRLARVAEHDGVVYWNDSKATNFHAVEGALTNFPRPVLLIAGGKSKGGNLAGFVSRIAPRVKFAFLLGETRSVLAAACAANGVACTLCSTLAEAVERAAAAAAPGDHVLLSPGFASFDLFRSYEDRGAQFERLVNNLGATVVFR